MKQGSHRRVLSLLVIMLSVLIEPLFPAFAQSATALRGLSAEELDRLGRGSAVIRPAGDYRKLALVSAGSTADELRARVAAIRPNYVTEVISMIPASDAAAADAILRNLAAALADPMSFVGIPYWSKQQQKTYDLFDKMTVVTRSQTATRQMVEVVQHMEPFDDFGARYECRLEVDPSGHAVALRFSGVNLVPIIYSYRNFKAVQSGDMAWELYAFRDGARIVFYGVGAVKAFDLFGAARSRLEASFMGRVEAFFKYMAGKVNSKQ